MHTIDRVLLFVTATYSSFYLLFPPPLPYSNRSTIVITLTVPSNNDHHLRPDRHLASFPCSCNLLPQTAKGPIHGHVGDGNFHSCLLFDASDPGIVDRIKGTAEELGLYVIFVFFPFMS